MFERFRRRRRDQPAPPTEDETPLQAITGDDAATLVRLARDAFAEHGLDTVIGEHGVLVGMDGVQYGLGNLERAAVRLPRDVWPAAARAHAAAVLASQQASTPATFDDARPHFLPSLLPLDDLAEDRPSYAPEVLPGLLAVAAIDLPTHVVRLVGDDQVDQLGGWDAIQPVAMANLRRLPAPDAYAVEPEGDGPGATVHAFESEDFFGASRLLLLDELVATHLGVERAQHGMLVAVPNRHLLAVHVITGVGVVRAMQLLAGVAARQHATVPGPVSPYVYLRRPDGRTQQVTRLEDDGRVVVEVTGAFADVFAQLGLTED